MIGDNSSPCEAACSLETDATSTIAVQDPVEPRPSDKKHEGDAAAAAVEDKAIVPSLPHGRLTPTPPPPPF